MSHFSSIGYIVDSEDDLNNLIQKVVEKPTEIKPSKKTNYVVHKDKTSKSEIWVQINNNGDGLGVNPYYHSKNTHIVKLEKYIQPDSKYIDASFYLWVNQNKDGSQSDEEYPLMIDLPDPDTYRIKNYPVLAEAHISLLSNNNVEIWDSVEDYEKNRTEDNKFGTKSFIPSGLFTKDKSHPGVAECLFTGIIKSVELKKNELGGGKFYILEVETYGGVYDVYIDNKYIKDIEPKDGGVINTTAWVTGRVTSFIETKRKKKKFLGLF